uniref:Disease resistance protein RGA4 n=1 Tax=Elaeis guineensis var. tenera TaxID=51953 RepID=A0A6I9QK00_ELAGV|nr:putative disease resistance protein RGA4 [Elaeis guineensis]
MERCGAPVSIRKNEALKKWMADLKDAAYDADDILDEFNYEVLRRQRGEIPDRMKKKVWDFFSFRNPNVFRIKMINKIKEIVGRLDNIAAEKSKFHLTEIGQADRQRPQTHSFVNESQIIGREKDKKKTVESLMSRAGRSDVSVLPIVGIGGLGKTTLAQLVYNEITAAEHFEQRMWVCVSEDFDIKKHRQDNYGISNRVRMLIFRHPWEELKELLTAGAEGSCVIVTTCSTKCCFIYYRHTRCL